MLSRSNWVILSLAVLTAALGGYVEHRGHRSPPDLTADSGLIGQMPPAISLPDLEGKLHSLSNYRGHRVLLNFWASWCRPCREEMPMLDRAQAKFGENTPIVVGIALDEPAHVRAFLSAHPVNYPILIDRIAPPNASLQLGDTRQILPYSVLLGADGRILATHAGELSASRLEQWLATEPGPP
jgi:peroxiredoxin